MASRHTESLKVGGGFGDSGVTIGSDGTIQADATITVDEHTLAPARLTVQRTTSNIPLRVEDQATSDSSTVIQMLISDGASGANNVNGVQQILLADGTTSFSMGHQRTGSAKSLNFTAAGNLNTSIGIRLNSDVSVDLPEGVVTAGTSESKQGILDVERGAAGTKPGTFCFTTADGSKEYLHLDNGGQFRISSSVPVNDTDGVIVSPPTPAYGGLSMMSPVGETLAISTVDIWTLLSVNNDWGGIEDEDATGLVTSSKANSTITINANGGGIYELDVTVSAKSVASAKLFWHGVKVERAIPITSGDAAGTIRITTTSAHNLVSADTVTITGNTNGDMNGTFVIKAIDSTNFDLYDLDGVAVTSGGGTGTGGNVDFFIHRPLNTHRHYSGTTVGSITISGTVDLLDSDVLSLVVMNRSDTANLTVETVSIHIDRFEA